MSIYLDNAATTHPKPEQVYRQIDRYLREIGVSAGRGAYQKALEAERLLLKTRRSLARLFSITDSSRLIFTKNITEGLNLALKGLLKEKDRVVTSSIEHNALLRPLKYLEKERGIDLTVLHCDQQGNLDLYELSQALKQRPDLLALTHASNLLGTIMPLREISQLAAKNKVPLLLDTAQTAGHLPLNLSEIKVDILAFTGHKGLYGPPGTGGLYLAPGQKPKPLLHGGTGGNSREVIQPSHLPDRYQAGTINTPALVGLGAGVDFILEKGLPAIREHEVKLLSLLLEGLKEIPGTEIYGPTEAEERVGLVSFNLEGIDPDQVAFILDQIYGIMVRSGLHCTPLAHETCGTIDRGAVRVGLSYFNTEAEIETLISALKEIRKKRD